MQVGSAGYAEDNEGNSKGSQHQRKTRDRTGMEAAIKVMTKKTTAIFLEHLLHARP